MKPKGRVAVFLSGRGSNFLALHRASKKPDANFRVKWVMSDKRSAPGLQKAIDFGLAADHIPPRSFASREEYEQELIRRLRTHQIDLICLAGYMRIVGQTLINAYPGQLLNIHPALLPSFPGLHAQKQALEYGVKVSGCTVHFVDSGVDTGPIILQKAVPLREADTEETLSERILRWEHRLYSQAVRLYFADRLKIDGRRVIIEEK